MQGECRLQWAVLVGVSTWWWLMRCATWCPCAGHARGPLQDEGGGRMQGARPSGSGGSAWPGFSHGHVGCLRRSVRWGHVAAPQACPPPCLEIYGRGRRYERGTAGQGEGRCRGGPDTSCAARGSAGVENVGAAAPRRPSAGWGPEPAAAGGQFQQWQWQRGYLGW